MGIFFAFFVGWAFGARGGKQEYDEVVAAAVAVKDSDEFATLLSALRHHAGYLFRQAAEWLDTDSHGAPGQPSGEDFIDRVRSMVAPGGSVDEAD